MSRNLGSVSRYRLLVLAPNWLGDVVMQTPLLSLLAERRSQVAEAVGRPVAIHLGIRPAWADLFRDDPRLDELVLWGRSRRHRGVRGTLGLASVLRGGKYQAVILGPPSLRSGLSTWLARIPTRVGYRTDGRSALLTHGLDPVPRGRLHYCQEMVTLGNTWLESLGLAGDSSASVDPTTSLPGFEALAPARLGEGPPVWAVAPGTTFGQAKTWPLQRLGDFMELALAQEGVRMVLLGDRSAGRFSADLKSRFRDRWSTQPEPGSTVVDLTGQTDLTAAARVLKAATAFIGNDSGLMHLAAALHTPTVGIFGSSNPDWTAPVGRHTRAVFPPGYPCRPCYRKTCNQLEFCLEAVTGQEVLNVVRDLVTGAGRAEEGF